jgi:hypothetical protein
MKKLLLFALTMGLGTMSFAQKTKASVDSFVAPTGTITTEDPKNGSTTITVSVTNNDTMTYVVGTLLLYEVTVDGNLIENYDVSGIKIPWQTPLVSLPMAPGETQDFILTQTFGADIDPATAPICVKLKQVIDVSVIPPLFYGNDDQNDELCKDFVFAWPLGVSNVAVSSISNIKTEGDVMTVTVNNSSNFTQIQVMSVTGQVLKSVNASNAGGQFTENINISDLTSGLYIVTIQSENGATSAKKVFIQ